MSVHEYPEPLVLAVDLDLQDGRTEERREEKKKKRGGTDETTELQ